MSDVATLSRLAPAVSQLPVGWYFDEKIFALEKKLIFDAGPGYVGHRLMVPEAMDYRSLEWRDHGHLLLNCGDEGYWQMSNVCRHRQAIMLQGAGRLQGNIVCPIHRWIRRAQPSPPLVRDSAIPTRLRCQIFGHIERMLSVSRKMAAKSIPKMKRETIRKGGYVPRW